MNRGAVRDRLCLAGLGFRAGCDSARGCRGLVGDALHLGHHGAAKGRAAPPARRARRGGRPCGAKSLRERRAHARRHAALSHHGRALASGHVAHRRRFHLPAPFRRRRSPQTDRRRARDQSLSGADALSRSRSSSAVRGKRHELGAQARLCRRADDRRASEETAGGIQARPVRQSLRLVGNLYFHHRPERAGKARLRRPRRHQPDGARGEARRQFGRRDRRASARKARSSRCLAGDESFEGYWRRPDADAKALRQGWYFTGDTGFVDADGEFSSPAGSTT